ncbi:MAG: DUF3604 domain-containing protein [Gammaproteobacteria bacterium]|nr:DUF3604 domain-containing protein [Gammaproteobacteria bacterium]MYJ75337.1 DUF3604 domain-containing protein [Gammaproteobacteria bacterium]
MRPILALVPVLLAGANAAAPYSPPTRQDYPDSVYWGDTHLHTYLSADAFPLGTLTTPDQAYRFAKGETVRATGGDTVRLRHPLDFLMVSDHAENLGVLPRLVGRDPELLRSADGPRIFELLALTPPLPDVLTANSFEEYNAGTRALGNAKQAMGVDYGIDDDFIQDVWKSVIDAAERHNDPGRFTTFVGYEYTSSPGLHRNVMFAGGPEHTLQARPFSSRDSRNPEDLWAYLEHYRETTGGDVISIPHNSNLSRGQMFRTVSYEGKPLSREYAKVRSSIEPIIEVTQIKGDSETFPSISPDDEFADHETWTRFGAGQPEVEARQSYARGALQTGLALGAELGVNPYKFGMIGSTDSHTGLATAAEDNFWGKMGSSEPNPYRARAQSQYAASGYAAVWATENTREAIFAAFKRREVYATTGPRITLRFFGGWGYTDEDASSPGLAEIGYRKGVPMGGDLAHQTPGEAPSFLVSAVKDPHGANLDRVQVIKGWRDTMGTLHEKIYDVAWSGDRLIGEDGKLPAVGSTVDLETANYVNSIGSASLSTTWTDPAFNPGEAAFYYLRVIQIPTPRWTTYDAKFYKLGDSPREVIQERAYSSPIWYTP